MDTTFLSELIYMANYNTSFGCDIFKQMLSSQTGLLYPYELKFQVSLTLPIPVVFSYVLHILLISLAYYLSPLLECKLHEDREVYHFCFVLYP